MQRLVSRVRGFVAAFILAGFVAIALGMGSTPDLATAQTNASVDIVDFAFSPATVTIEAGGTVTWVNGGGVNHTATGDGGSFDTGTIVPGGSASITFDTPGTYTYFCAIHPSMTGTVVVVAVDEPVPTELPDTGVGAVFSGDADDDSGPTTGGLAALAAGILAVVGVAIRRRRA